MKVKHLPLKKRFTAFINILFDSSNLVVTIIIGIVLVPLYLKFFGAATYGAWLASAGVISMVTLLESGLSTVLTQKLSAAYSRQDYDDYARIVGSGLSLAVFVATIIVLVCVFLAPFLVDWVKTPETQRVALRHAIILTSLGAGISIITYSLGSIPMSWQRTSAMGLIKVCGNILSVIVVVSALFMEMGVMALSLRNITSFSVCLGGISVYILCVWKRMCLPFPYFEKKTAYILLKHSLPLFFSGLSNAVANRIEAPVAAMAISPEASTVLILTGKIIKLIETFVAMVGSAVFAGIAHLSELKDLETKRKIITEIIIIFKVLLGCGMGLAIAFSKPICFLWVGKNLFGGFVLVLLIAFFSIFSAMVTFLVNIAVGFGHVKPASACLVSRGFLNIVLLLLFIFPMKIYSIPFAGALSSVVVLIFLSTIVGKSPGLNTKLIYLSGTKGFLMSLGVGILWAYWVPIPETWLFLTFQGLFCLMLIVVVPYFFDKKWSRVIVKNFLIALEGVRKKWPRLKFVLCAINLFKK